MNYLTHSDSSLSLFLSVSDMSAFGVDSSSIDYSNEHTRKMLRFYIELAKSETSFSEKRPILLECFPQKNGGCIVKITSSASDSTSTFYVASGDFSSLLLFANAISNKHRHIEFTIWRTESGLALSFSGAQENDLNSVCLICKEFCELHSYSKRAFSVFTEHADLLFTCDAAFLASYIIT